MLKVVLIVLCVLISGCRTAPSTPDYYAVGVDSITIKEDLSGLYYLYPANSETNLNDLQFVEFGRYVVKAIKSKGLMLTSDPEKAKYIILLDYGVGDPTQQTYTIRNPTWGQTGYSGSNSNYYAIGDQVYSNTTYTPQYGVTGYTNEQYTITKFTKFIKIMAFDNQQYLKHKKEVPVFTTGIYRTDQTSDLRAAFPYMITAAMPYIGESTNRAIEARLYPESPNIPYIFEPTQ